VPVTPPEALFAPVKVIGGRSETLTPECVYDQSIIAKRTDKDKFTYAVDLSQPVKAPVKKGDILGTFTVLIGNEPAAKYNITAPADIPKMSFLYAFAMLAKNMFTF